MQTINKYQVMPNLSEEEFESLKQDIAERGVQVPVEYDEDGNLLDGHHRVKACQELGIKEYPTVVRVGMSEAEKLSHARRLNLARRHLNREQKRELIKQQLKETPEKSNSALGQILGVDHKTVGSIRSALETTGEIPKLDKTIGADGKARTTAPKRTVIEPIVEPLPKYEPEPINEVSKPKPAAIFSNDSKPVEKIKQLDQETKQAITKKITSGSKLSIDRQVKEIKRERQREENKKLVEKTAPVLTATKEQTFQTIVLDPPWDWGDEGDSDQFGRSRPTYATMSFDEILNLPVNQLADKNAHIYLWITNRSLPKGFQLLESWEFRYITAITWCKPSIGMGNYYRGSTEHILFGVRGSLPLLQNNVGTHFTASRPNRHSAKPDEFYQMVESCSPGQWLEMFCRSPRNGWVAWGAEANA